MKKGRDWPEKFPLIHRDKEKKKVEIFLSSTDALVLRVLAGAPLFLFPFFSFFFGKILFLIKLKFSSLVSKMLSCVKHRGGRRETLYFYLNFARVAHQTKRTTKSSQTEARRRPLKTSVGANSSLICIAAWELQTLLSTPHAASAKCQVHHHFKPLLVLLVRKGEKMKRKRKSITQHEISANQCARCKL